ncbi:MAG TPA: GNAT family N-acetyltransferase, partial [Dehalococcoidia bacterium]|nr:GNAT family N-acetyltransferase [Dehalococcoidia bacterium]
ARFLGLTPRPAAIIMSYMQNDGIAAAVLDTDAQLMAFGCEQFEAGGAMWVRDRGFPSIYDANHVCRISVSDSAQFEGILARADVEFAHCSHRRFHVDFRTGPLVTARLALDGYTRDDSLLMLLDGELAGSPGEHDVRPVRTDDDWRAYAALKAADWEEHRQKLPEPKPGPEIGEAFVSIYRRKAPDLQYYLAYIGGKAAAFFAAWPGGNGMGQVEDLFTLPEFRRRGLATALMHRCVRDCRERGARKVIIACDPGDTPKQMYSAMGFVPVALASHYLKRVSPAA